jgi:hypothetical protein
MAGAACGPGGKKMGSKPFGKGGKMTGGKR